MVEASDVLILDEKDEPLEADHNAFWLRMHKYSGKYYFRIYKIHGIFMP